MGEKYEKYCYSTFIDGHNRSNVTSKCIVGGVEINAIKGSAHRRSKIMRIMI